MAPKPTLGRARRGRGRLTTKMGRQGGGLGYRARGKRGRGQLGPNAPRAGRPGFQAGAAKPGLGAPGAAPPSPAKPMAPAAPVGQRFVPDSIYENRVNALDTRQDQLLNELEGQEGQVKHEFGIEDPTNPFSRAEGLKRAFLSRQKAASASLASQGQLYSGAHERALSRTRRDEEQARAELRKAYEGAIGQIGSEKAGVKFSTEEEKTRAFEDWLARQDDADVAISGETAAPEPEPPAAAAPPKISPEVPVAISNSRQETTTTPPKAGLPLAPPPPPRGGKKGKLRTKITGGGAGLGYKPRAKQGGKKKRPNKSQMQPTTVVRAKPRGKVRRKGRR